MKFPYGLLAFILVIIALTMLVMAARDIVSLQVRVTALEQKK